MLRYRDGHSAPPTKISFYDANGENILSAGWPCFFLKEKIPHRISNFKCEVLASNVKALKYSLDIGEDSTLRSFSVVNDLLHKSLGCAYHNRKAAKKAAIKSEVEKMTPIIDFSAGD